MTSDKNPYNLKTTTEYKLISEYYGERRAARSGVPLINHIDEGDYILWSICAPIASRKAFFLHPLVQSDVDMQINMHVIREVNADPYALILAMEYRNIANQYLSHRKISSVNEIALSPIPEVNTMLIADKIQNYKDFILYHRGTHPRSDELVEYFENWLTRLEIYDFDNWFRSLNIQFKPEDKTKEHIEY